jgi:hypothetical protein
MSARIDERRRREAITATGEPVHEICCGCVEFYWHCNAMPEGKTLTCADYHRLPDVLPGTVKQPPFPASRMQGRKEPRLRVGPAAEKTEPDPQLRHHLPERPRRPSPAAQFGLDGRRLCGCGAPLPKRKRCCDLCRVRRRAETLRHHKSRKRVPAAV